jgi:hypothetical protein
MEYRSNATAGFVLPPPTILPPNHGSGWPIAAIPEHPTKQEFDRIPIPHSLQPLVHDDIPLNKMNNGGYRNEESPISPYDPSNPIKSTQPGPKSSGNGTKARPPRRSSANGVVACRQWCVRQTANSFRLPLNGHNLTVAHERSAVILPDRAVTTVRVVQASVNTTQSQNAAVQTSAQGHVAALARNGQSTGKTFRTYGNVGRQRRMTNIRMEMRLFGPQANHRTTSPLARSRLCQTPR